MASLRCMHVLSRQSVIYIDDIEDYSILVDVLSTTLLEALLPTHSASELKGCRQAVGLTLPVPVHIKGRTITAPGQSFKLEAWA